MRLKSFGISDKTSNDLQSMGNGCQDLSDGDGLDSPDGLSGICPPDSGNPPRKSSGLIPLVFLKPGEVYMSGKPAKVSTVLGSCVSVTMFLPERKYGAICHGLLPRCHSRCCITCNERLRYIDCSIKYMLERIKKIGAGKDEIEVKVFGGGDVLPYMSTGTVRQTVGRQNIESALNMLHHAGLVPKNIDVGGNSGRKLFFYTHTGEVLLKRIRKHLISTEEFKMDSRV